MRTAWRTAFILLILGGASLSANGPLQIRTAQAAPCARIWVCTAGDCGWRRICRPPSCRGYECYPLYGAYGPWGGTRYWGSYSYLSYFR